MAQIRADEITRVLRSEIENYEQAINVAETGSIISVGDGIARVYGLERVMAGELIEFPHNVSGLALNLEEDQVGAVLLGDFTELKEGDEVRRTGRIMSVPVGDALIGRVVDALGNPIDGKGPIVASEHLPIERIAPGVVDRGHHRFRAASVTAFRLIADGAGVGKTRTVEYGGIGIVESALPMPSIS